MADRNNRGRSGGGAPTAASLSARQRRLANRAGGRSADVGYRARSGGFGPIVVWSLVFGVIGIVIVAGAFVLTQPRHADPSASPIAPFVTTPATIPADGHTLGSAEAPVTIDIYGDFRCSACYVFATGGTEKALVDNYVANGKAKLVYHDYLSIDKLRGGTASRDAANAAWCAADQGKFWPMHDWLYANSLSPSEDPAAFGPARLKAIGGAAGLDMPTYTTCLTQGRHNADIAAEDAATPAEVNGTPTIFVDGTVVTGPVPNSWPGYDRIKAAIDATTATPSPAEPAISPAPSGS
jgi:protein-disulfide isomerase